jgi:hypothetical protein
MKTSHWLSSLLLIFTIVVQLAACGISAPATTAEATIMPSPTLAVPTNTEIQPSSFTPTPSPIPVSSPPEGLRMAYIVDDNLYYQNGANPPLQLTNRGEDKRPLFFSEDGRKVFFTRGRGEIYSIDVDGNEEQALVTTDLLLTMIANYDKSTTPCNPVLVPNTQFLLFNTCYHSIESTTLNHDDLFIADAGNNLVSLILPEQGGASYVSPNGKMIAVDRQNSIDILGIDGRVIRSKIATYPRSELISTAARVYWVSDSKELIMLLPSKTFIDTFPPPSYTVWRFSFDTHTSVQIHLDPTPTNLGEIWVSPDGNWITYFVYNEGMFLGNLQDGITQAYQYGLPHEWSPDSMHFIYEASDPSGTDTGLSLASVNALPVFIGKGGFIGWLDASKYLYYSAKTFVVGEIGKEPIPILVGPTQPFIQARPATLIFNFQRLNK